MSGGEVAARQDAVELIDEGARLHYEVGDDDALLRGDRLYAEGLARLAEAGDLEAIARLADTISLVAQANAEGEANRAADVWEASHRALRTSRPNHGPR